MLQKDINDIWRDGAPDNISYPKTANKYCFAIEESSFWFQHRNNVILSIMKRFPCVNNFADIGGGNGFQINFLSKQIKDKIFYLIEPGYEGCLNAKERGVENVYNIEFQKFPFQEMNIGGVGLFDVLEHIDRDKEFLVQLKSFLGKGKYIYLTTPAHMGLWSEDDKHAGHFRRYTLSSFENLSVACDMKLVYSSYFFTYLPIPTYLIRSLPSKLGIRKKWKQQVATKEHKLGPYVKRLLSPFNSFELRKLENSSNRFGASCIVVYQT